MKLSDTSRSFTNTEVEAAFGKPKPTVEQLLKKYVMRDF